MMSKGSVFYLTQCTYNLTFLHDQDVLIYMDQPSIYWDQWSEIKQFGSSSNSQCDWLGFEEVVVERVHVHISSSRCTRQEASPLPENNNKCVHAMHQSHCAQQFFIFCTVCILCLFCYMCLLLHCVFWLAAATAK